MDQVSHVKYMDTYTVYVESGVATQEQVIGCMKKAIGEAEKILKVKDSCKFKVNLILDKEGKYFGFGYIRVSNPKIYWMLLGKNPDGSERVEERVDPNWKMPTHPNEGLSIEQILDKNKNKSWFDISKEDDIFVQPKIKVVLPPLVTIPGFLYDKEQIAHLKELQQEEQEEGQEEDELEDPAIIEKKLQTVNLPDIPNIGYFEISRAYASDPDPGMMKNRLCARNVPDWIPIEAFKSIFSFFLSSESTKEKVSVRLGNKDIKDTYPIVNFVESKNAGKIVFVTFDPNTKDAIFALLMTKKTHITNPKNPTQKTTLIFMHAFDNQRSRN
jgi:hypothetical protein